MSPKEVGFLCGVTVHTHPGPEKLAKAHGHVLTLKLARWASEESWGHLLSMIQAHFWDVNSGGCTERTKSNPEDTMAASDTVSPQHVARSVLRAKNFVSA